MRIKEVLASKPSHDVVTVRPDATVRELLGLLAEHNIGALVVSGDGAPSTASSPSATSYAGCTTDESRARRAGLRDHVLAACTPASTDATVNELMAGDDRAPLPARPGGRRRPAAPGS